MDAIVAGLQIIIIVAILAGLQQYFKSYIAEKAKNLATREDLDKITRATQEIKEEISGKLWIGQKQWELKRDIYKNVLEVVDEMHGVMRRLWETDRWTEWDPRNPERGKRLETERDQRVSAGEAQIATATQKLHQTAVFSQVVLSERGSRALRELVEMLKEKEEKTDGGAPSYNEYLPRWIARTDEVYEDLIEEAKRELSGIPVK